jgi:hypothetical protein
MAVVHLSLPTGDFQDFGRRFNESTFYDALRHFIGRKGTLRWTTEN